MSLTLRQVQKMFSASRKSPDLHVLPDWEGDQCGLAALARVLSEVGFRPGAAVIKDGRFVPGCSCCSGETDQRVGSKLDALVRRFGPEADVNDVANVGQQEQASEDAGDGEEGEGEEGEGEEGEGEGAGGEDGDSTGDGQPSKKEAKKAAAEAAANARAAAAAAAAKAAKAREALAKQELAKAMAAAAVGENKPGELKRAKDSLRHARRQQAMAIQPAEAGPSLEARRTLSAANGRLMAVPTALKAKTAALINRLVLQGGTAGENLGPVPRLSASKLVKRMLVRRPLPNALKEDVVSGRPVTLFLPDVSPSCKQQAQAACDLANAAGYSGVPGSDVLVLPHSNGCVSEHEDSFIPWLNGRPLARHEKEIVKIFSEVTTGKSRYKIRAVIAIGDHDASTLYEELALFKSIRRIVWLHNGQNRSSRGQPAIAVGAAQSRFGSEAMRSKVSLVYGCTDGPRMLTGLALGLKSWR